MTTLILLFSLLFSPISTSEITPKNSIEVQISKKGKLDFQGIDDGQKISIKMVRKGGDFKFKGEGRVGYLEKTLTQINEELFPGYFNLKIQTETGTYTYQLIKTTEKWLVNPVKRSRK